MNWFISLSTILVGSLLVMKTQWIYDFIGPIEWAEQHLGTEGGTRLFIKLIGVVMIFGVLLAATGLLGSIVRGIFGPFLRF